MQLIHGGDWAGYQTEYSKMPLDFSANVSPLGLPEGIQQAIIQALPMADRYPDPLCRALREKLAQLHHLPSEMVLCGNGAADLIFRLVLAARPKTVLLTAPTFAEYAQALKLVDCNTQYFVLQQETKFAVTEEILEHITPELDMLFLCEPNNPTGRTTDSKLLHRILLRCADTGTRLIIDECFNEFLENPAAHTLIRKLTDYPNLVILKAFTKWYAMAGVRLGYILCKDTILLDAMSRSGQPWSVSTLAQAAGLAALEETAYSTELKALINIQRPHLKAGLQKLGCKVIPGEANYLLFCHPDTELAGKLRTHGILLRDCANYRGLGPGWYRTAVRTRAENDIFLHTMKEVL